VLLDWVRDAIRERARRYQLRRQKDGSWRYWIRVCYEASQSWIVVLLVGKETAVVWSDT
jgi:hypothetical protein